MDISQIKNLISSLGLNENSLGLIVNTAKPFLESMLNIDDESFDILMQLVPKFIAGEIDLKTLLPLALPIFLSYFSSSLLKTDDKKTTEQTCSVEDSQELSQDLKNISPDAFSQLAIFMQSDNAS